MAISGGRETVGSGGAGSVCSSADMKALARDQRDPELCANCAASPAEPQPAANGEALCGTAQIADTSTKEDSIVNAADDSGALLSRPQRIATVRCAADLEKILNEPEPNVEVQRDGTCIPVAEPQPAGETPTYAQGQLDQFLRMKNERPIDPVYWDGHEETRLREAVAATAPVPPQAPQLPARDTPLEVVFENGCLVVRIGIGTLAWGADHMDDWNPYDEKKGDFVQRWMVTDPDQFAKDVMHEMLNEREDGSHPLSDFFDAMANEAADQGSIGVDECKTGRSVWETERINESE